MLLEEDETHVMCVSEVTLLLASIETASRCERSPSYTGECVHGQCHDLKSMKESTKKVLIRSRH